MRIAFGLTTHKNPGQVRDLVDLLQIQGQVYLHHDGNAAPLPPSITSSAMVTEVHRRPTFWGTFHMVEVFLEIMELALTNGHDHVIFLSGQDMPVASRSAVESMLSDGDFQMDGGPSPCSPDSDFGYRYHRRWYFKPGLGGRPTATAYRLARRVQRSSGVLQVNRTVSGYHWSIQDVHDPVPVFKARTWFSLNVRSMRHVLGTVAERPDWIDRFRHTRIPEEAFFATLLMNSDLSLGNARRFCVFEGSKPNPRLVTGADLPDIERRDAVFARKFDAVSDPENYQAFLKRARTLATA